MRVLVATALVASVLCGTSSAESAVWYRFSFTGEDLINNVFVDGVVGDTPASLGLLHGARWIEDPDNGNFRSYIEDEHEGFQNAWDFYVEEEYVFDGFNLWGFGTGAEDWGETYEVTNWRLATGPNDWEADLVFISGWGLTMEWFGPGIPLSATNLSEYQFTVDFDSESFNGLPVGTTFPTTVWFGADLTLYEFDDFGNPVDVLDVRIYQGNMQVQTEVVPEPSSLVAMSGLLLCGGLWHVVRRRRRKSLPER